MRRTDTVIIGGGLGGLECGAILAREGVDVCLLEKNARTGGCLQSFRRDGRLLDTGMHYAGSLGEGQMLRQYFRYMGVADSLRLEQMDGSGFERIIMPSGEYPMPMGYDRFAAEAERRFPAERDGIARYCEALRRAGDRIGLHALRSGRIVDGQAEIGVSASAAIGRMVGDPVLRGVLAGTNMLYGGVRDVTPFYTHAVINHSNIEGACRFAGGSQQLADALADSIRRSGGEVHTHTEAVRIVCRGGAVEAVETSSGERIECRRVISSLHPAATYAMSDMPLRQGYVRRLAERPMSCGMFTAYCIMRPGAMPYEKRNCHIFFSDDVWRTVSSFTERRVEAALVSMTARDDGSADTVSIMTPVRWSDFERWSGTRCGRRGEEYEQAKAAFAERLAAAAGEALPGLREATERIYACTPLTYRDWTGTHCGAAYGMMKDCRMPMAAMLPVRSKIGNLLFTGQNPNFHGAVGVSVTAACTCAEILGEEYLAERIGYA